MTTKPPSEANPRDENADRKAFEKYISNRWKPQEHKDWAEACPAEYSAFMAGCSYIQIKLEKSEKLIGCMRETAKECGNKLTKLTAENADRLARAALDKGETK